MTVVENEATPLRKAYSAALNASAPKPDFCDSLAYDEDLPILRVCLIPPHSEQSIARWLDDLMASALVQSGVRGWPMYRGVAHSNLDRVLCAGIDVIPTDAVFWATDDPKKALEYGGDDRIVLIFDVTRMRRSFCELAPDASPEAIMAAEKSFGSDYELAKDGTRCYSRLPRSDRRRCSPYEAEYGWYFPSNPKSALAAIIRVKAI